MIAAVETSHSNSNSHQHHSNSSSGSAGGGGVGGVGGGTGNSHNGTGGGGGGGGTTNLPYFFLNSSLSLFGGLNGTSSSGGGVAGSALNASDIEGPVFPSYIRTTSMIFCIVILGIGVIGNIMVPLVILKSKDMRNSTNIFLMNLSIADLMVLLVCTPTVLVEVNSKPETWVLGEEMCK